MGRLICVVDDDTAVNKSFCDLLKGQNFDVESFPSADKFVEWLITSKKTPDLILSDVNMPGLSGYDLCRSVRTTDVIRAARTPIILVTGSADEKAQGLEAGADEFLNKPVRGRDLIAKVESLLHIREDELSKSEKLRDMARFVSPAIARLMNSSEGSVALKPHRGEVTVLCINLVGYSAFSDKNESELVLKVLNRYYAIAGHLVLKRRGTVVRIADEQFMAIFNDPEPIANHHEVASQAALEIRELLLEERVTWNKLGYELNFGMALAEGFATMGLVGFARLWQYSAVGPVSTFASQLAEGATDGNILLSKIFCAHLPEHTFQTKAIGSINIKSLSKSVFVLQLIGAKKAA